VNKQDIIDELENLKGPRIVFPHVAIRKNDLETKIEASSLAIKFGGIIPLMFAIGFSMAFFSSWKATGFSLSEGLRLLPSFLYASIIVGSFFVAIRYIESLRIKAGPFAVISNYNLSNYLGSSISVSKIRSIVDVYFTTKPSSSSSRTDYRVIFAVHDEGYIPILWQTAHSGSGCRPKAVDIANLFQVTHQKVLLGDIKCN
jgi:hypothetical protein